jgi:hypothetical protein
MERCNCRYRFSTPTSLAQAPYSTVESASFSCTGLRLNPRLVLAVGSDRVKAVGNHVRNCSKEETPYFKELKVRWWNKPSIDHGAGCRSRRDRIDWFIFSGGGQGSAYLRKYTLKVEPTPTWLSNTMRPSALSIIFLTM